MKHKDPTLTKLATVLAASAAAMVALKAVEMYTKSNTTAPATISNAATTNPTATGSTVSVNSSMMPVYSSGVTGGYLLWPPVPSQPGTGDPLPQFTEPPKPDPPPVPNGNCEICGHEGVIRTLTYYGKPESWQGCGECAKLPYIVIREMMKR
jgi:hypothetical protein